MWRLMLFHNCEYIAIRKLSRLSPLAGPVAAGPSVLTQVTSPEFAVAPELCAGALYRTLRQPQTFDPASSFAQNRFHHRELRLGQSIGRPISAHDPLSRSGCHILYDSRDVNVTRDSRL